MQKPRVRRHEVVQPHDQSIRLIPLTRGQNAIVDAADYDRLMQWNWTAWWNKCTKSFYATRGCVVEGKRIIVYMHRFIAAIPELREVDHRDKNTLNNRRCNLRACSSSQNKANRGMTSQNKSGIKGVSWNKRWGKWQAFISVGGKTIYLGGFASIEEATDSYGEAAKKYFGEFAHTGYS